ncbi:MAG: hypothetical protein WB815_06985 [Nitrososphaeraceae archaeon]
MLEKYLKTAAYHTSLSYMLGEQFYENKDRITNQRVLEIVETGPKMTSISAEDNNSCLHVPVFYKDTNYGK